MKSRLRFLILLGCLAATPLLAQTPADKPAPLTPQSFDARFPIAFSGNNAFYSLILSEEIYRRVHTPFLTDVRVFNSEGKIVPHIIRELPDSKDSLEANQKPLKFYPVFSNSQEAKNIPTTVSLTTSQDTSISVKADATDGKQKDKVAYILEVPADLSKVGGKLRLKFNWQSADPSFIRSVWLDDSEDLETWRTLAERKTLTRFKYNSQALEKTDVTVYLSAGAKYLRLSWLPSHGDFPLTRAEANYDLIQNTQTPRQELTLNGALLDDGVIYDLKGNYPVRSALLTLPQANSFFTGELSTCQSLPCRGRHIASPFLYRLNIQNTEVGNDALTVEGPTFRYLQLRSNDGQYPFDDPAPALKLEWLPHRLIFLAQGLGPFTLAVGRKAALPALDQAIELTQLIDSHGTDIPEATLAALVEIKPQTAKPGEVSGRFPYKTYGLWAIMILGTCMLAIIAWRLLSANEKPTDNEEDRS